MHKNKAISLFLSLLYTSYGIYFAFETGTKYWWGLGILVGIVFILLFLKLPAGQRLLASGAFDSWKPPGSIRQKKKKQGVDKVLKELEEETESFRTTEVEITLPTDHKPRRMWVPSKLMLSYVLIGGVLILLDKDNIFFSTFMGFATTQCWFNAWLYW